VMRDGGLAYCVALYENRRLPRLVNKASVLRLFYHPLKPVIQ
jgi:hypothetical protein